MNLPEFHPEKSKAERYARIFLIAFGLGALPSASWAEENADVIENQISVMQQSGFSISAGPTRYVFQSNGNGTYKITARFDGIRESEDCKGATHPRKPDVQVTVCTVDGWTAPAGFETKLANNQMDFRTFWDSINRDGNFPSTGGDSIVPHPITVSTFTLNPEFNQQMRAVETDVLQICFDPEGRINSAIAPSTRIDCRNAKGQLSSMKLEADNKIASARNQEATARNQEATAELEKEKRVGQALDNILEELDETD